MLLYMWSKCTIIIIYPLPTWFNNSFINSAAQRRTQITSKKEPQTLACRLKLLCSALKMMTFLSFQSFHVAIWKTFIRTHWLTTVWLPWYAHVFLNSQSRLYLVTPSIALKNHIKKIDDLLFLAGHDYTSHKELLSAHWNSSFVEYALYLIYPK